MESGVPLSGGLETVMAVRTNQGGKPEDATMMLDRPSKIPSGRNNATEAHLQWCQSHTDDGDFSKTIQVSSVSSIGRNQLYSTKLRLYIICSAVSTKEVNNILTTYIKFNAAT